MIETTVSGTGYHHRKLSINLLEAEEYDTLLPVGFVLPDYAYSSQGTYQKCLFLRRLMLEPAQDYLRQQREAELWHLEQLRFWITRAVKRGVSREWGTPSLETCLALLKRGKLVSRELLKRSLRANLKEKLTVYKAFWRLVWSKRPN